MEGIIVQTILLFSLIKLDSVTDRQAEVTPNIVLFKEQYVMATQACCKLFFVVVCPRGWTEIRND